MTGSNTGIGKETARDLAGRGAVVILACRDRNAAQAAITSIRVDTQDGDLVRHILKGACPGCNVLCLL